MDNTNTKQKSAFGRGRSSRSKQLAQARLRKRNIGDDLSELSDAETIIYDHDANNNSTADKNVSSPSRTEIKLGHLKSNKSECSEDNTGISL